jgi:hypothetical protein
MEVRYLAYALALLLAVTLVLVAAMLRGRWKANSAAQHRHETDQADMAKTRRELLKQSLEG